MAIRYSGDVEVRVTRIGRRCRVAVRWPTGTRGAIARYAETLECARRAGEDDSAFFDRIATGILDALMRRVPRLPCEREGTRPVLRRVFQAPCPTG